MARRQIGQIDSGQLHIERLSPGDAISILFENEPSASLEFIVANPLKAQGFAKELTGHRNDLGVEFLASIGSCSTRGVLMDASESTDHLGVIEPGEFLVLTQDTEESRDLVRKFALMKIEQLQIFR